MIEKLIGEYSKDFETCAEDTEKVLGSTGSTSGTFNEILGQIEEEFKDFANIGLDKKIFLKKHSKLILILVSGKYDYFEKIKKIIIIIAVEITLK